MKKLTVLSLLPILLGTLILTYGCVVRHTNKTVDRGQLIGTWQICNPDSTAATNLYGNGLAKYKVITNSSFTVSEIKKKTNIIIGAFSGIYSLDKNKYTESVLKTNGYWGHDLSGENRTYKIEIKDGYLFMEGINNPYKEIWMKVTG